MLHARCAKLYLLILSDTHTSSSCVRVCHLQEGLTPIDARGYRVPRGEDIAIVAYLLEKARARRNWAKVRAVVHVYPYAMFWYAHACAQLCAPGGAWAERDRAAFDEEFRALRE